MVNFYYVVYQKKIFKNIKLGNRFFRSSDRPAIGMIDFAFTLFYLK